MNRYVVYVEDNNTTKIYYITSKSNSYKQLQKYITTYPDKLYIHRYRYKLGYIDKILISKETTKPYGYSVVWDYKDIFHPDDLIFSKI